MTTMLLCAQRNVGFALFVSAIMITEIRCGAADCPHCKESQCIIKHGKPWCGHCAHGYYWVQGTCFACDQNCVYCTPSECPIQCEHLNGKCKMGCKRGYYEYQDTESQVYSCRRCSAPNCIKCDHDSCTSCEDGYYEYQDTESRVYSCRRCSAPNCIKCDHDSCTSCEDGYFLQDWKCVSCNVSHCKSCRSVNDCNRCEDGYYLESEHQCYKCNGICRDCYKNNDRIVCKICTDGNNVNPTDTCNKCPHDARFCYPVNGKLEYSKCSKGYYGPKCRTRCSSDCYDEICREGDGYCASCMRNYYGPECNIACSNGCSDTGEKFDICDRITGHCTMGCKHTLRGELCDIVDGQWSDWQDWSQCSVTCGQGTRTRERTCNNLVPQNEGQNCDGNDKGSRNCDMMDCPVDGQWSDWQDWSKCSVTCGQGTRTRERTCNNHAPQNGGLKCYGLDKEDRSCTMTECTVDGQWSDWQDWSQCSVSCGQGTRTRERTCNNHAPQNGGLKCYGLDTESRSCTVTECPVDGQWSQWSGFSICSTTCGDGTKYRSRTCNNPEPSNGGANCSGDSREHESCVGNVCAVDGQWSDWQDWSQCSVTCGQGTQTRERTCNNPVPQNGGLKCYENDKGSRNCDMTACPDMIGKGSKKNSRNQTIFIGCIAGGAGFVIICTIVIVVVCFKRRKRRGNNEDNESANTQSAGNELHDIENAYALPNKFRAKDKKDGKNQKNGPESEFESADSAEPPPIPTKSSLYLDDSDLEEVDPNSIEINTDAGGVPEDYDTYYNTSTFIRRRMTKEAMLTKLSDPNIDCYRDEFERLANGLTRDYRAALKPENNTRNRYKLVYPYDVSRVIIQDSESDYINASYIDGYNHPKAYIACLGPTAVTTGNFERFWKMIWQEDVEKIVMLTHLMEGTTMKCEQYWPDMNSEERYGQISVQNILEVTHLEYTVRTFKVKKKHEKRDVIHMHFTAWPDKNVPDDVISLLDFRKKVVNAPTKLNGPTAVHCSAGIGRTGTYIALDYLIQEGQHEESVDVFGCVNGIRGQRTNLVQNLPQYMYLHYALVHVLIFGEEVLSSNQFQVSLSDGQKEVLGQQFRALQQSNPRYLSQDEAAAVRRNMKRQNKNRQEADIPGNRNRVQLRNQRKSASGGYINAVYIHEPTAGSQYIVAQTPLTNTVEDFFDLVMQENVHTIVCMDPTNVQNVSIGSVLPTADQCLQIGTYMIRCLKQSTMNGHVFRKLEIAKSHSNMKRSVNHYQCLIWDTDRKIPSNSSTFVNMILDIEKQQATANTSTLVHCLKAAERSCLYCAVSMLLHEIEAEKRVNVINTITRIRARRPKAIPTEEHFYFCHECIASFIEST